MYTPRALGSPILPPAGAPLGSHPYTHHAPLAHPYSPPQVRPSVAEHDRRRYERVHALIKQGVGAVQALKTARDRQQADEEEEREALYR